jgi:diphthamide biosynthesis methyltransferase
MIQELVTTDGELFSKEDEHFYVKILNHIPFEEITSFFIKKSVYNKIKENQKKTNGSCGLTDIDCKDVLNFLEIKEALVFLEEKNKIFKKKGINKELYFLKK